jgi:Protein of unknown function (DUF2934)
VIDPTADIRFKPARVAQPISATKDNAVSASADSVLQTRAYELYERRGRVEGYADRDWYQAEAELATGTPGGQKSTAK